MIDSIAHRGRGPESNFPLVCRYFFRGVDIGHPLCANPTPWPGIESLRICGLLGPGRVAPGRTWRNERTRQGPVQASYQYAV